MGAAPTPATLMPDFSVLGGLAARTDSGTVELGTYKQRAILAQLILAQAPVSVEKMIGEIWGETAPDRVRVSVQSYISGLRRALQPDRSPRAPSVIVTRGSGYLLAGADRPLDLRDWYGTVTQAQAQWYAGRTRQALALLTSALDTYQPLLPEFEGLGFRDRAASHLDCTVQEARKLSYEIRIRLGDHRMVLPELVHAVESSPFDEGLQVLYATALYCLGRQSDALAAIAGARRSLAEHIGVSPGRPLAELETAILRHHPESTILDRVVPA